MHLQNQSHLIHKTTSLHLNLLPPQVVIRFLVVHLSSKDPHAILSETQHFVYDCVPPEKMALLGAPVRYYTAISRSRSRTRNFISVIALEVI